MRMTPWVLVVTILLLCLTEAGAVVIWESGKLQRYTPFKYKAGPHIFDIAQDQRGVLYFANDRGVLEFDSLSWRLIKLPEGKPATNLVRAADGRIYVGGEGEVGYLAPDAHGIMRYRSLRSQLPVEHPEALGAVLEMHADADELLFMFEQSLLFLRNGRFHVVPVPGHLYRVAYGEESRYVFESNTGLSRLQSNGLTPVPGGDFFLAHALIPQPAGQLLLITQDKGILRYDPSAQHLNSKQTERNEAFQSLGDNPVFRNRVVTSWEKLEKQTLLLAVEGVGLVQLELPDLTVKRMNSVFNLKDEQVYRVFVDRVGSIWVGTSTGIVVYHTESVMRSAPVSRNKMSAMVSDKQPQRQRFAAMIRKVESIQDDAHFFGGAFFAQSDGIQQLSESNLTYQVVPFAQNALRFTYSANDFRHSESVQFQSYLEGMESEWSSPSERRYREYTNLNWRNYTFHVRAVRPDGTVSTVSNFSFQILPPWYETWWFYSTEIGVLLLLLLIAGLLRNSSPILDSASDYLVAIVVLIIFVYLSELAEAYVEDYADDVFFYKLLMMIGMGMLIEPLQHFARLGFAKIDIGEQGPSPKMTDHVTGLGNRQFLARRMKHTVAKLRKTPAPLSFVLTDIHDVESVYQTLGLESVDQVLAQMGKLVEQNVAGKHIVVRYMDEKFLIAMVGVSGERSRSFAENLQREVKEYAFHYGEKTAQLTINVGIASHPEVCTDNLTYEGMLHEVDLALNHAMAQGPGQIVVAPVPAQAPALQILPENTPA